jgi:mRNA interferase RelE/StbE
VANFQVILLPQALKFYKSSPLELAKRLNKCFETLEKSPFSGPNIKLLKTKKKLYRYRIGNYRIIYEIDKKERKVGILLISQRSSVYRNI